MTPDEAVELRQKVAEILGWTEIGSAACSFSPNTYNRLTGKPPDGYSGVAGPITATYSDTKFGHYIAPFRLLLPAVPEYSTDWSAIPEMVKWIEKTLWQRETHERVIQITRYGPGQQSLMPPEWTTWEVGVAIDACPIDSSAPTLPEAVARFVVELAKRLSVTP